MFVNYYSSLAFKCSFRRYLFIISKRKLGDPLLPQQCVIWCHSVMKRKQDYLSNCVDENDPCHKANKTTHLHPNYISSKSSKENVYFTQMDSSQYQNRESNKSTQMDSSQYQNRESNKSIFKRPCETIVHKYSPVPSLPHLYLKSLSIAIPEEPSKEEVPSFIHRFFLGWFTKYLKRFRQSLATEMPDTFHMFDTFMNGFKEFVIDFRHYITVVVKLSLPFHDLEDLSRKELELYYNMPRQMCRVFPVLAISSLPFAQNFVLPVAYLFPKHLLCYQFWDTDQRKEFTLLTLKSRLFNSRPVFRCLQTRADEVDDPVLMRKCLSIFFSLGSGVHPTPSQILEVKPLFSGEPYEIKLLFPQHVNGLLRLHNRSVLFRRRRRLREHARYIRCLDNILQKEGVNRLEKEQLWNMLLLRGISPMGMSRDEMQTYLQKWIFISRELEENDYSLLLHLPIFLAYNHPMNLDLLYRV